ncbi:Mob1/phocein [Stachybotrys elegans]|uniref:Mob1/phocein n=1 Tax=Stachybotrys elegans TaxID=80388 RepID=A0A8K0WWI6_9HYPO|nr:Mob1/phocein [Stachybotrys elegans]
MSLAPSSPRLPSPPPPAEIQLGPNSPSGGPATNPQAAHMEQSQLDANSKRRIHPGTKACDWASGPPLVPLNELDSAFQLQEHLAALHHHHSSSGTRPLTRSAAFELAQSPAGVDRTIWLYELCRFLISQCNSLIVGFLFDAPPCSANTCPEMRASEWQFLCAVHEQPKSCCAIDYCCHTLDWAANIVTDQKIFPSRFVVLNDTQSKNVGVKNLVNVFRRLHRIFAHAWFQHRSVFWSVEGQTGLYVFFKAVCDMYELLPAENYKLPPEAEGLEAPAVITETEKITPTIMKPPTQQRPAEGDGDNVAGVGRTNTRRHIRSSPSTGSAVTTVLEADEEDGEGASRKLQNMHISAPETVEEEPEVADVPVIVERSVIDDASSSADPDETITMESDMSDAETTILEPSSDGEGEPEAQEPSEKKAETSDEPTPAGDDVNTKTADESTGSAEAPSEKSEDAEANPNGK